MLPPNDECPPEPTPAALAALIDHTLLKPQATSDDVRRVCDEALQHRFCSVCVNPVFAAEVSALLAGSGVKTCVVAGFPLGAHRAELKAEEARRAIGDGAREIDMVLFVGGLKAGRDELVLADLRGVTEVCRAGGALSKVILETCLLTDDEKRRACALCVEAGADFVKTSTGFSTGGATVADVALMSQAVRAHGLGVKASGGLRTLANALAMLRAGATRIGASASVAMVREAELRGPGAE